MTSQARRTKKANFVLPLSLVLFLLSSLLLTNTASGVKTASPNYAGADSVFEVFELEGDLIDQPDPPGFPPRFDWNTINAIPVSRNVPPMIAHTGLIRDPAPSSVFSTAGSRDNSDITEWRHSTGNVLDKGDISNAYAAAFLFNDELIFVVGADRLESGEGTLGFWFLQKRIVAAADGTFRTGTLDTDLATHTIGDLLVVIEFTKGGLGLGKVYKWVGSNGDQVGGTLQDVTGTVPFGSALAIANGQPLQAPWLYVPRKGPVGIIPVGGFFEGAVNVTEAVPEANFLCSPTVLVESRLSLSLGAQLQDFVLSSFRPSVSVQSTEICEGQPAALPFSLSEGTPPYTLDPTSTDIGVFVRGITIGATTPGRPPGSYVITTTATDVNRCFSTSQATLRIKPNPVCNLSAPDALPVCGSQNNTLSAPSGFANYSWSVVSPNNDWVVTSGANSQTVTYTAGSGSATFRLVVDGSNSCKGKCEVTFSCG